MSKLRVLMYHKIDTNRKDFLTVLKKDFEKQMQFVSQNYTPIRLSMLMEHIQKGTDLPKNSILITFDDGFANNFHLAYPVCKRLNLPFAIFPVAKFIGTNSNFDGENQEFLNKEQMLSMSDLVEFGYHSHDHKNLMEIEAIEWKNEIKKAIETAQKFEISMLPFWAYTYGSYPKNNSNNFTLLKNIFKELGIISAFRIGNRLNILPLKDQYKIERIDIRGNDSFLKFRLKLRFGKFL